MEGSAVSISAVYVSWRDTEVIVRSLGRLAEVAGDDPMLQVVVVINEARDAADAIEGTWPGATVIVNTDNRGFGPACNQGAEAATGEIFLFLNPDTLVEGGALDEVRRAFEAHPDAVAVAPRLIGAGPAGDEDQRLFQLRRLPTPGADARELLLVDRAMPGNRCRIHSRYLEEDRAKPFEVEQAAAAALAVRRDAFESIGGFDERFWPAYWEDVDLCLRLRVRGPIVYWPAARVTHVGGSSAGELGSRRFRHIYYSNALRYREKHYSRTSYVAYRVLLTLGMTLRATALFPLVAGRRDSGGALRGFLDVVKLALRGPGNGSRL